MHRNSVSLLLLLNLGVLISPASGQPPLRPAISVMNLKAGAGIVEGEAVSLTDHLLVELEGTKRFEVTERAARDSILKEVAFQQTGACDEASCLAEMARYPIVIPQKTVCDVFTNQIRPASDRIIASIHETPTLVALRDTLMLSFISGELSVKDAERIVEIV
jgi:type I restriction enzyme S subunit